AMLDVVGLGAVLDIGDTQDAREVRRARSLGPRDSVELRYVGRQDRLRAACTVVRRRRARCRGRAARVVGVRMSGIMRPGCSRCLPVDSWTLLDAGAAQLPELVSR